MELPILEGWGGHAENLAIIIAISKFSISLCYQYSFLYMARLILLTDFSEEYAKLLLKGIVQYSKEHSPWGIV